MKHHFFMCIAFMLLHPLTHATSTEQTLSHYILSAKQEQRSLLEQLVNINSDTSNIAGVRQVGELLRHQLDALGFNTHWVEMPESMQRAGTLIATHSGSKGKRLLLIGHLDTVFPSELPFKKYKQTGHDATGPGVIDDKGGDVVMLFALKALKAAHALDDANITVVLTGDEEDAGKPTSVSRKALIEAAAHADVALDFEWAFTIDTATIGRRGMSHWLLNTQGKAAHASVIFQSSAGDGAIFELARILNTMRETLAGERYLSFNPGLMTGGTLGVFYPQEGKAKVFGKDNVIAKMAMASGDLRFLTEEQKSTAEDKIKAIVSQHLPGTTATVRFQAGMPGMVPTPANVNLLNKYSEVSVNLGFGPVHALDPGERGAGDISFVAAIVPAALAGLGPVGTGAHTLNETVVLHSLPIQTQRAAVLMYRLTRENNLPTR
jgi:glutamate carboxypeptidase